MVENILLWCLFGLVAGALAQFIMPGKDPGQSFNFRGLLVTIVIGILGALVGGYLGSKLFGWDVEAGFNLASIAVAVGGALLLLIVYRLVVPTGRTA